MSQDLAHLQTAGLCVKSGDHLSHWAASLASVGEESKQQGHILKELESAVSERASS